MSKYKPFVLTIHNDPNDERLVKDIVTKFDDENVLSAANMMGMCIQELLLDKDLFEKMMKRVVGKIEMADVSGKDGQPIDSGVH